MGKRKYLPKGYVPTREEANKYIARPYSDVQLVGNKHEETLDRLFRETLKENKDIHDILVKCSTLNGLASTVIYEVQYVAERILKLNIDNRLEQGDLSLVKDIASRKGDPALPKTLYSFASKYCSYHQPDKYSIYDRYVALVLTELQDTDGYSDFKRAEDLKDYNCYMKALEDFRKYYGFPEKEYSKKAIDKYLWLFGKECVSEYNIRKNNSSPLGIKETEDDN